MPQRPLLLLHRRDHDAVRMPGRLNISHEWWLAGCQKIARGPEALKRLKEATQGKKRRCHLTDKDVRARNSAKKEVTVRL